MTKQVRRGGIVRRNDREVKDIRGIEEILRRCRTCHVAMIDGAAPYVTPLSFGYEISGGGALCLYFHSAAEGRKIDILRRNDSVCFDITYEGEPILSGNPCNSGIFYASVIGFGKVVFIEDADEKRTALSAVYRRQTGENIVFTAEQTKNVCVFKIVSTEFTGKSNLRS